VEWAAELWSKSGTPLHVDGSRVLGMRQQGCRFPEKSRGKGRLNGPYHPVLAGVRNESGRGSRDSHRNCGVRFRTQCHARPQIQRAVQRRTQLAAERGSQAGTRCATRCAIDCRVERDVDVQTDDGAEFPSLRAIVRRVEPRTRRATDERAKSLIDGHIDGGSERGLEPRSHPRIDPPVAGRSASLGPKGVSPGGIPPVNWFPDSFPD
jgi:hypothetical protein